VSGTKSAPWYSPFFRLRWRLAVVYSALFGVFVILLSIFLFSSTSNLLLRSAQAAFPQRARALRTLLTQEMCSTTSTSAVATFLQQNIPGDVDKIYLLNKHGTVVASSDGSLLHQLFPFINPEQLADPSGDVMHRFQVHFAGNMTSDGLLLDMQVPKNCLAPQSLPGYLALTTSYTSEQNTLRTILLMLGVTAAFMIVIGASIISFFTGIMFRPLGLVTDATRALAQGNLQQRVPPLQSRDEISDLAASFNQMADRIEQMFAAQQASEQRVRRFVSDASHELRTPITSLRGFTEVLIRGAKDDPATAQRVLGLMKNEAERMSDLVNSLLTLARLDEGQIPETEEIDLVDTAIECLQHTRKRAPGECKLSLELSTQDRLRILANGEQIKQMLLVLLDNAIKYGCLGEQKKVLLQLDKQNQHARLQVIDYGPGIATSDLEHIFDRFYRGENAQNAPNTPIAGTGLGLAIAISIAQAYQGLLTACSEPGRQTTFTVIFPNAI
jgi:two-component system OmpR family sensor kinase